MLCLKYDYVLLGALLPCLLDATPRAPYLSLLCSLLTTYTLHRPNASRIFATQKVLKPNILAERRQSAIVSTKKILEMKLKENPGVCYE